MAGAVLLGVAKMEKSEAQPGVRVIASLYTDEFGSDQEVGSYFFDKYGDYELIGVIQDKPAAEGKVWVEWLEGDCNDEESEVGVELLALESSKPQMEEEFEKAKQIIRNKMEKIAELINEAGELAIDSRAKDLQSMYKECAPLINAMDSNGWNSSSWNC